MSILAWTIDGCQLYLRDGLKDPECVIDATANYFESEDAIGRWIEDRLAESPQSFTASSVLFANWQSWAMVGGEHIGTMKAFVTALNERLRAVGWKPVQTRDGSGPRGIRGVAIKAGSESL